MNRRKFIRGTGLIGGLLGGVLAGKEVIERIHTKETVVKEMLPAPVDIADVDMQPVGNTILALKGNSKPPETVVQERFRLGPSGLGIGGSSMVFNTATIVPTEYDLEVGLSVGRDKRLWVKIDGEWRRVALDPNSNEG